MQLKQKGKIGGLIAVAALAVTIVVATVGVAIVRMDGPLSRERQQMSDLNADILPPPEYVVEPYLEATLLVLHPETLPTRRGKLAALHSAFADRYAYWQASDLAPDLKADLLGGSGKDALQFWEEVNDKLLPAVESGDRAAMLASRDRLDDLYRTHRAHIVSLVEATEKAKASIDARATSVTALVLGLLTVMAIAICIMVWYALRFFQRRVLAPVSETANTMSAMAHGDLDAGARTVHRDDEIGEMTRAIEVFRKAVKAQHASEASQRVVVETVSRSLDQVAAGDMTGRIGDDLPVEYEGLRRAYNSSVGTLAELIGSVARAATSVSSGSLEIRSASDDLAIRNERQATFVEETAAALDQLVQVVRVTTEGTGEVSRSIASAHGVAEESRVVVGEAIGAMGAIEESAGQISQIINVIDGIAFQTNLLALNAGVEAARAGEAGKGFAVVATEVRALAQRSADAARDIKELISKSSQQVGQGVALVNRTGEQLSAIVERVGEVNARIGHIAGSADKQSTAIEKIAETITELDRMTQQNAAMVEQSNAAARSLADQAGDLAEKCSHFRTGHAADPVTPLVARRVAPTPPSTPAAASSDTGARAAATIPVVSGNLALKQGGDDWSGDGPGDWDEF